jgi:FtsH-binding integral membrane protein
LIILSLLQVFFPGLRTGVTELLVSGFGIVLFAVFIAFDIQRISALGKVGANPFLLAL